MTAHSAGGALLLLLLGAVGSPALMAQSDPAYTAANLACVSFRENIRSDLTLETGGNMASATSGREGVLIVSAVPASTPATLNLVAWFDSLQVWRTAGGQRTEPDASGVLGGRYRGLLLQDGTFSTSVRPFVPETLREVTELSTALDDLLPRLPPGQLQVGEEWRTGDSIAIKRLSDSAGVLRYNIRVTRQGPVIPAPGDTLTPTYTRTHTDRGVAVWDAARGPMRYDHEITVEALVPVGGAVRRPARSQVIQRIILDRLRDPPRSDCPASLFAEP